MVVKLVFHFVFPKNDQIFSTQMKLHVIIFLLTISTLFGDMNFPNPSIGVPPIAWNNKIAYFSGDESSVTIIDSSTNHISQSRVSQRVISMFQINDDVCVITVDGNMQLIEKNGNVTTKKILNNGGVISAASIGNTDNFAILAFQDGDEGLKIILFSKQNKKFVSRVLNSNLPRGTLTYGRGNVWFNSEEKSFKINAD